MYQHSLGDLLVDPDLVGPSLQAYFSYIIACLHNTAI